MQNRVGVGSFLWVCSLGCIFNLFKFKNSNTYYRTAETKMTYSSTPIQHLTNISLLLTYDITHRPTSPFLVPTPRKSLLWNCCCHSCFSVFMAEGWVDAPQEVTRYSSECVTFFVKMVTLPFFSQRWFYGLNLTDVCGPRPSVFLGGKGKSVYFPMILSIDLLSQWLQTNL